jgi:hypothetical protein
VFATHLHLLVNLLDRVPNIQQYMMEVVASSHSTPAAAAAVGGQGNLGALCLLGDVRLASGLFALANI